MCNRQTWINQSYQIIPAKSFLPNQSCQIKFGKINPSPSKSNVGPHSSFPTLVVDTQQVPLATQHVLIGKSEKYDSLSNEQHVRTTLKYKK